MKVKNVSAKIIGIVGELAMPDDVVNIPSWEEDNESIKALVNMGFLKIVEEEKKAEKNVEEVEEEEPVEEKPKTKRTTRKKVTVEE